MSINNPVEQNISGVQSLVSSKTNKIFSGAGAQQEGPEGDFEDEFTLKLSDEELISAAKRKSLKYQPYETKLKIRQDACKTYYLGRQKEGSPAATDGMGISANLLFEAEETFLPAVLAKNPEPVVYSDGTPEGNKLSNDIKTMLSYHADVLVLRRKLSIGVRNWSLDFLGCWKHGWDDEIKEITTEVRDTKKMVFDVDGYVDAYGDFIGDLGERITITAIKLIELFPKKKEYISETVKGKLGTDVTYTEWWTDEYCFYTYKDIVLDKHKNPSFKWPTKVQGIGLDGNPTTEEQPGKNHFARAKKPYTFLSVFSLGQQPHDVTSLIEQNIPNQRRVSRRTEQLDFNLSRANNSQIYSENNFNQETAKQASMAFIKGHPVLVPSGGPISDAIHDMPAQTAPDSFFRELENSKTDLRAIFGVEGITSQPDNENITARGMILNQSHDSSRIGGGIGDALEQVADNIFNWWVQLYYVYYDEPHVASIMGNLKAQEYVTLSSQDMNSRLVVSVSPDSLKSHDEITEINQAIQFYQMGAIGPKTLLTIANFPDPDASAMDGVLWKVDPQAYMQMNWPDLAQRLQAMAQQAQMQAAQAAQQAQGGMPGAQPLQPTPPETMSAPEASSSLSNVPL